MKYTWPASPATCWASVRGGVFFYQYDAWNRLVKVAYAQDTDAVVQTAKYDGLGRRVTKTVTNAGDLDGTFQF